jgi:broad specificity phosphatase PhoE
MYRHGQTDLNLKGLAQSTSDFSLNLTGIKQAKEIAKSLDDYDLAISSTLAIAKETAEIALAYKQNIPLLFLDGFEEVSFGICEKLTSKYAKNNYPEYFKAIFDITHPDTFKAKLPQGESHQQAIIRFFKALTKVIEQNPLAKNIVIFSHGALICAIYKLIYKEVYRPKNAEKITFCYNKATNNFYKQKIVEE